VKAWPRRLPPGGVVQLFNKGVGIAQNDIYSLLALSKNLPEGNRGQRMPTPDIRAVGVQTYLAPPRLCSPAPSFLWAFAINTWERQTHLMPVSHQVWLDTDQDGVPDFVVLNRDGSFDSITNGRQMAWAVDLNTGFADAFFFVEHATNTNNTVLLICGEQIGLSRADIQSTNVDAFVVVQDFYYGGPGDLVPRFGKAPLTITPLGEQYFALPEDMPGRTKAPLEVTDFGPFPGNSPELGVMLFTNGDRGEFAFGGATEKTEALLLTKPGVKVPRKKKHHPRW
jgi:hypothetical protein